MAPSCHPFHHQPLGVYVSGKVATNYQQIGFTDNLPVSRGLIGPLLDSCLRSLGNLIPSGFLRPPGITSTKSTAQNFSRTYPLQPSKPRIIRNVLLNFNAGGTIKRARVTGGETKLQD